MIPKDGQRPGTRIGIPDRVSSAWSAYDKRDVESTPAKVHYDVLRESGFPKDRAREIASKSADAQGRLLEEHRDEHGTPIAGDRRGASRFKTPAIGAFAGRLCRVLDDGTLQPCDEGSLTALLRDERDRIALAAIGGES